MMSVPTPRVLLSSTARLIFGWLFSVVVAVAGEGVENFSRPNFLIIVADDLGLSDLGFAGSEIATPNLDQLAQSGVVLRNFYVAPTCSPTRSMLLSGTDHHLAGLGVMHEVMNDQVKGKPGYEGYLNQKVLTLPARLKADGYSTFMAGKWHLGLEHDQSAHARGFDRSFTLLGGGASHFSDMAGLFAGAPMAAYRQDGESVKELPGNFFSSTYYSDRIIEYIDGSLKQRRPFFGYLAYTAPHWPLHAPEDYIKRYQGVYDQGWDALREKRMAGLKATGLVSADVEAFPRLERVKAWSKLTPYEKKHFARRMEIYAAMVEHMDAQIGRVLRHLEQRGALENTYVMFFSDNGPEGNDAINIFDNYLWVPDTFDNRLENMGKSGSYVSTGTGWAQVSAVPYRLFKSFPSEGGVHVPGIISYGNRIEAGSNWETTLSVMDVAPTVLELAGVSAAQPAGKLPMTGRSFADLFGKGDQALQDTGRVIGWELFGRAALRQRNWKALRLWEPYGPGRWELYDLSRDPAEMHDLAKAQPGKLEALVAEWNRYVHRNGIVVIEQDAGYAK